MYQGRYDGEGLGEIAEDDGVADSDDVGDDEADGVGEEESLGTKDEDAEAL